MRIYAAHLPRNAAENEQHTVIEILAVIFRFQRTDPIDLRRWNGTDGRIGQSEWNADPLMNAARKICQWNHWNTQKQFKNEPIRRRWKTVGWRRCRPPNTDRRRACRKWRCTPIGRRWCWRQCRRWRWWSPLSHTKCRSNNKQFFSSAQWRTGRGSIGHVHTRADRMQKK